MKKNKISEDINYGIYDRPAPKMDDENADENLTVGEELPIDADQMMAGQLSVQRPPIEDDEFVPGSVEELSRSASAVAQLVPSDQVEFFYRSLHKLLDKATDNTVSEKEPASAPDEGSVKEEHIRRRIRGVLKEILSQSDVDELDAYRGRDYDTGGIDYFGGRELEDELAAASDKKIKSKSDGTVSLEQIASEFGYSGPSGVRQEIKRLTDRLNYFVTNVKREDLNSLIDFAVGEYVDAMLLADLVDEEDVPILRGNPGKVKESDSFRFFFVSSFVIPAYREVTRLATRSLNDSIEALAIPQSLHQTVFNQVTGASSQGTIAKKLATMAKKGEISKEKALELVKKIESSIPSLKLSAEKNSDLVDRSLEKWSKTGKTQRRAAIEQAIASTAGV